MAPARGCVPARLVVGSSARSPARTFARSLHYLRSGGLRRFARAGLKGSIDRAKHGGLVGSRYPESVSDLAKWFASRLHGGCSFHKRPINTQEVILRYLSFSLSLSHPLFLAPSFLRLPLSLLRPISSASFFLPSFLFARSFTRRRRLRPSSSVYNPLLLPPSRISFIYLALFLDSLPFVSHRPVVPSSAARFFSRERTAIMTW